MKLFVCSDIHGFYTEFKDSLDKSGYDKSNPEHKLVILGDFFDRGSEAKKVKEFIMNEKALLVRGNHDDSLMRIYQTGYLKSHNYISGTFDTMKQLGDVSCDDTPRVLSSFQSKNDDLMDFYDKMPYYIVLGDILFVHSWFPDCENIAEATRDEWHNSTLASLSRKIVLAKAGIGITPFPYTNVKRIVFGHHKADDICDLEEYTGPGIHTDCIRTLNIKGITLYGVDGRVEETHKIPILVLEA